MDPSCKASARSGTEELSLVWAGNPPRATETVQTHIHQLPKRGLRPRPRGSLGAGPWTQDESAKSCGSLCVIAFLKGGGSLCTVLVVNVSAAHAPPCPLRCVRQPLLRGRLCSEPWSAHGGRGAQPAPSPSLSVPLPRTARGGRRKGEELCEFPFLESEGEKHQFVLLIHALMG